MNQIVVLDIGKDITMMNVEIKFQKRPEPLIRKSKSIEQREMHTFKKEVDTYRQMYLTEQQKLELLIAELILKRKRKI